MMDPVLQAAINGMRNRDKTVEYRDIARIVWNANPLRSKVHTGLQCFMCNKRFPDELFTDKHAPLPGLLASHCNECRDELKSRNEHFDYYMVCHKDQSLTSIRDWVGKDGEGRMIINDCCLDCHRAERVR